MFLSLSELWFFLRTTQLLFDVGEKRFPHSFDVDNFAGDTTQSFVGALQYKKNPNLMLIYKISQEENNIILNEYEILTQLNRAALASPHFVRAYGLTNYSSPVVLDCISKLTCDSAVRVDRTMLLLEYVANIGSLYDFLERKHSLAEVTSLMAQVLIAIRIMRLLKISHNDLHGDNIVVKKCDPAITLKYVFKDREVTIPTFGYCAVIIDFGLGRSNPTGSSNSLLGSFHFTHIGFHSDKFGAEADYVRFLSSFKHFTAKRYPTLSRWCARILKPFKGINAQGWDTFCGGEKAESVVETFNSKIRHVFRRAKLLGDTAWVDNLQLLVKRPIQDMQSSDISVFNPFFKNWSKFEERIKSMSELNYLFKCLVFSIKLWKEDYLNPEESDKAVEQIKQDFLKHYEVVVKFHCPQVNYEDMICSLILGACYLESYYFTKLQIMEARKPPRGGLLAIKGEKCDDEVWRDFSSTFGKHLARDQKDPSVEIKTCFLWDL